MRCFLFASLLFLCCSCNRQAYKDQRKNPATHTLNAADLRPRFEKTLYRCVVDGKFAFKRFHLSGILYLRHFNDAGDRVVFQSEMGNTFFDFGWDLKDSFQVHQVIEQMNKPALIKTLRKDFELLLGKRLSNATGTYRFGNDPVDYIRFELQKGFAYYLTDSAGKLKGIENADEHRKVVIMTFTPPAPLQELPEAATIQHLRAHFTIELKKITPDDTAE